MATSTAGSYCLLLLITALAPLSWTLYSIISKPLAGKVSPLLWTFLATGLGSLMIAPLLPGRSLERWSALDGPGWGALLYLIIPCTVFGFALWTWLLRYLPASVVGFTVFLNPPLTTLSKLLLSSTFPDTFQFSVGSGEIGGGLLALIGLAVVVGGRSVRQSRAS